MKIKLSASLASLVLALCASAGAHAQATINDCEKIQAADAYNQCLAKFGPPAKTLNMEGQRPGDVKSSSEEAAAGGGRSGGASGRRHGRGRAVSRRGRGRTGRAARTHGGGRKRMSISVGK